LYALSELLQVPIDTIVCGNRKTITPMVSIQAENSKERRLLEYYKKLQELPAA
jgi:hypothetical protein